MSGAIARRYTLGLFEYASEHGVVQPVDEGLGLIASTLTEYPEFKLLFEHPLLSVAQKTQMFSDVFATSVDPLVVRFVKILLERGRSDQLIAVSEAYHAMSEEAAGVVTVHVESALSITDTEEATLQKNLSTALGKQARTLVAVKPELIAGYRIQIGNRVIDATVQGALAQFASQLLDHGAIKEGTH